ncbi:MAG: hypothetical protein AAFZ15_29655, partial [Bacteroidota bacterium]
MHQSKLIQLLKSLETDEFRQFSKFVRSPVYNTNPTIVKYYNFLRPYFPEFNSPRLQKEKVFEKLFPGKPYNYHVLGNLNRQFVKLTKDFLVHLEIDRNNVLKEKILIQSYGRRNLFSQFEKGTNKLKADIEKSPYRDYSYYQSLFELSYELFFHPLTNRYKKNDVSINELMKFLDRYFVMIKMHLRGELKTRELAMSKPYKIEMSDEVVRLNQVFSEENQLF